MMNLDFFDLFGDPYMRENNGRGFFLAGVALGILAAGQVAPKDEGEKKQSIDTAPIYKQLTFGRLKRRDILKHLGRVPELSRAYNIKCAGMLESLTAKAGEFLFLGDGGEMGIEGNFAFSVGFLDARNYFWEKIFKEYKKTKKDDTNNPHPTTEEE